MDSSFTDFIPYILAALAFFSFAGWLLKYLWRHDAATSPDFQQFKQEAQGLGNTAREKAEDKVDEMFRKYKNKDKSP